MKLLKIIKNNTSIFALLLITTLFLSCSDYIDVDTDTDNPTVAPLNQLLTNIEVGVNDVGDFNDRNGSILQVYTHQMTVREEQDQYGTRPDNIPMVNDWNATYLTLTDIKTLIEQGTASNSLIYVGIGQMLKAYLIANAVDLWGDVPYSEATQLATGIISPKFDNQKAIYASVFELIETAKVNLSSTTDLVKPSSNDLFYSGDPDKWIRFANTFKLKLYNQLRLTSDFDQAGFDALIAEDNFFKSNADDFEFKRYNKQAPTDERNRFFLESYTSTQFTTNMSPWFYEILKGMNPNIHTENPDPRIPYYFFNQLKKDEFPPDQGNAETGDPRADYWDASTGFFSIRFGSIGPNRDFSTENSGTYPGIFPSGGRYDDGKGGVVDELITEPDAPTGIAPHRILTYDEFLYIQAELMQVGKMTGNVADKLEEAMQASFAKVDLVVTNNLAKQDIPILVGSSRVTTFIEGILTEFNAGDTTKKLEIVMTQKWVATFGDPTDQYTDYRRTGFPILANPDSSSKEYQLDNKDGFPIIDSQTVLNNAFQQSLFWPQSELNTNKNAPKQKVPGDYKIFWDN